MVWAYGEFPGVLMATCSVMVRVLRVRSSLIPRVVSLRCTIALCRAATVSEPLPIVTVCARDPASAPGTVAVTDTRQRPRALLAHVAVSGSRSDATLVLSFFAVARTPVATEIGSVGDVGTDVTGGPEAGGVGVVAGGAVVVAGGAVPTV